MSGEEVLGERLLEALRSHQEEYWIESIHELQSGVVTPEQWARRYVEDLIQGLAVVPDLRLGGGKQRRRWVVAAAKEEDIAILAHAVRVALAELETP